MSCFFLVQTWTLAVLLALCGHKRSRSQAEMGVFFFLKVQTWTPAWAPGLDPKDAVLKQKMSCFFVVQTWTPGRAPGPVWTPKTCGSQAEMSCFFLVQTWTPWLGSWPCVGPKEAVLKQK